MKVYKNINLASVLFVFLLAATGCHSPASDSGFLLQPELMKANVDLPFDAVWYKENIDLKKFNKVMIADINTDHLLKMSWWDKLNFAELSDELNPEHEAKLLATYFKDNLNQVFTESSNNSFTLATEPDEDTLLIELAIVEVVPTKVWLNSFSYLIAGALDTGATAIEGRFRDGKTNEVLFRFKDKKAGPFSLVNVGDFTWYSHAKDSIAAWSKMIVATCNRKDNEAVPAPVNFTLLPW